MTPVAKALRIKELACRLRFDRIGISDARASEQAAHYRGWLAAGYGGEMAYLHRDPDARGDPCALLPGARSVICAAVNYRREDGDEDGASSAECGLQNAERMRPLGRVARYARGSDYHSVLHEMLAALVARMKAEFAEPFESRICVDTAPLLERDFARRAGLGWIGKNTMLLHADLGSYLFLGEVITTLELTPDQPVPDHCGNCTRCLDACPTQAFVAPRELDASRCVAYLTIEKRGDIPAEYHAAIGDWVFGCDVCQEVCPFNRRAPLATHAELSGQRTPARVDLLQLVQLTSGGHRRLTRDSAARRASRRMWQRNAAIALKNVART
jgi:epoxyqueuosine reductase